MNILELASQHKYLIVDFFAEWCGPCRILAPIMDELSALYTEVEFIKIDVEQNSDVANELGISGLPTMLFFRDGKIVDRIDGFIPKNSIISRVQKLIEKPL